MWNGNYLYERRTKTDFERRAEAIRRLNDNGMNHWHIKMNGKYGKKINTNLVLSWKNNRAH
jgi:hypothetical protein